jgi:hypothetical protein
MIREHRRTYFHTAILVLMAASALLAKDRPEPKHYELPANATPQDAHTVADAILIHRFMALLNEYWIQHPREEGHAANVDAHKPGQRERLRAADRAWREYFKAMEKDGY